MRNKKIPETVAEGVELLVSEIGPDSREYILNNPACSVHFFAGMTLRNEWGLWKLASDSAIKRDAAETYGLSHADGISGLIYDWVWARVRGERFDPLTTVERYEKHWAHYGMTPLEAGTQ